jgi:hypothetical protein
MSWRDRVAKIAVNDRVAFAKGWLQSTGQHTGDIPFARGKVTAIKEVGEMSIATVDWDGNPEIPTRVNVRNLARVTERGVLDRE